MEGRIPKALLDRLAFAGFSLAAFLGIAAMAVIVYTLVSESLSFFRQVSLGEFILGREWSALFKEKQFGTLPLLAGTLLTSSIGLSIAAVLGLGSAIFLSEYASPRVRRLAKPIIEVLAGIPTVVYGYFALTMITPFLKNSLFEDMSVHNALAAGIALGVMMTPMVASISEDALYAVPDQLRQGAYALGARKHQVVFKVVFPAAMPGIVAAFILALARAVGETMIVTIAAGFRPVLTLNPLEPVQTLTAFIAQAATGDNPYGTIEYRSLFAVGLYLFLLVMALNTLGLLMARKYSRRYGGGW